MKTMKLSEFRETCKKHWPTSAADIEFICPNCKTVQTANDLIEAGAGKDFDEVNKYMGFSCVGRFTDDKGCDWSLGGLFQIHDFELVDDESGQTRPCFELNLPVGKNV